MKMNDSIEAALKKVTHDLEERVKELDCLYAISALLENPQISMDDILRKAVNIIPRAWQYPEAACCRITLDHAVFRSGKFAETPWTLRAAIHAKTRGAGVLEIFYKTKKPDAGGGHGPFLLEEVKLITALSEKLGKIFRLKAAEAALEQEKARLQEENRHLKSSLKDRFKFRDIIGKSAAMQAVYERIIKAAGSDEPIIISGESGTGKELVARAVHDLGARKARRFITVNCGAIPENLLESEFFGYRKGAFTGAYTDKAGLLETVDGGSLFLDEIGELSLAMQVKLLRVLAEGDFLPVGGRTPRTSDFRVIAATNRDLAAMVKSGRIREDFFYRINVIPIDLPPLRNRREDIPLLAEHFLNAFAVAGTAPRLPAEMIEAMLRHDWPGNVRELQNVVRRYLSVGRPDAWELSPPPESAGGVQAASLQDATEAVEKSLIRQTLEETRWNQSKAALRLGISRRALYRKIKKHRLV